MLLRFSATNYKSLYHSQELSMVTQTGRLNSSENPSLTHEISGTRVVPYALIYGANASGKSNLIASLSFLRMAIIASHVAGGPKTKIPRHTFLLVPTASSEPTELDADFVVAGVRYNYGFKATNERFLEEWLYVFPASRNRAVTLFYRSEEGPINFGPALKGSNKAIEKLLRHNSLFISTAAQNGHPTLTPIFSFFEEMNFENMTGQHGSWAPDEDEDDNGVDERIVEFLRSVSVGIVDARLKKIKQSDEDKSRFRAIANALKTVDGMSDKIDPDIELNDHSVVELGHQSSSGEVVYFDLGIESNGTRGLLALMSSVFKTLDEGGIIIVDEIDASVHTQVCEAILALFSDCSTNPHGAQLIATTHDTNLLCSNTIKRDQIWFAEKNTTGETVIFPLTDFKPRKDDNFQKGYLKGRFGAIPFSGNLAGLFKTEPVA